MSISMRCLAIVFALAGSLSWAADLTVANYSMISSKRVSVTDFEYVYRAQVVNKGPALRNVVGTVSSAHAATVILEGTLSFGDVAAGATVTSVDTFSFRHNRTQPFDPAKLVWSVGGTPDVPIRSDFSFAPAGGDAPVNIRFTPTPITNVAITRYEWDLDGNGTADVNDTVGRDQTYTYTNPGTYAVSLKITDSQGRTDTRVKDVVIGNAPPAVTVTASPTNGQVPLTVSFFASATDSDGIARYDWDFNGDGRYDRSIDGPSGASMSFAYTSVGTFKPKLRVTDGRGASTVHAVPSMEVRAAPVGSPTATLIVSPPGGQAPLTVTLHASAIDPQGRAVRNFQWDPDGNGTFDATTTADSLSHTYTSAGTFYPRVRITMVDGRQADDVKQLIATANVSLALSTDTLDAQMAGTVGITTVLSADTRASIVIETKAGAAVRTLFPLTRRSAGTYTDTWDGKDGAGRYVPEGIYKAVLVYELDRQLQRLDLSTTTGGREYNPPRTNIPPTFEPYNQQPLTIDFTLSRASEVTAFMGSYFIDTRYVTFYTRQPLGRGTHRITWNGTNANGQIIKPGPGDYFLFGIFGYLLPDNAVFVRNGVQLGAMASLPPIFDPTAITPAGRPNACSVTFTLSLPATVELVVQDAISGGEVARLQYPGLDAGANAVLWDGKTRDGRYAAPGTYRLGLTAIQSNGFRSMSSFVLQRVYY